MFTGALILKAFGDNVRLFGASRERIEPAIFAARNLRRIAAVPICLTLCLSDFGGRDCPRLAGDRFGFLVPRR